MSLALKDKVVIVTGAGAGIGLGILRQVAKSGARVHGFDVDNTSAGRVEEVGGKFHQVDVSEAEQLISTIEIVRQQEGALHGLVSNAGVTITAPFLDMEIAQMDRMWAINQRSVLVGVQAAAKIMVKDGTCGSLVNIGSNHSKSSDQGYEAYAGTKGAIAAMTRAMSWSLGRHGVRVNTLAPGLTMTETVAEAARDENQHAVFKSWHALDSVSIVEEIGQIAVFLLSEASSAITGSEIVADKGMSARLGNLRPDR